MRLYDLEFHCDCTMFDRLDPDGCWNWWWPICGMEEQCQLDNLMLLISDFHVSCDTDKWRY